MAHLPWSPTASERRVRRALAALPPEDRRVAQAIADGERVASCAEVDRVLDALRAAYADQD